VLVRQGKGKKDRMTPIGERALAWIEKYRVEVRPELVVEPDCGVVCLTMMGEGFSPGTLTELVRDYVDKAQLGKRGGCHLFRHTVATLMLEGGADVRYVQKPLDHAQLATTQIYPRSRSGPSRRSTPRPTRGGRWGARPVGARRPLPQLLEGAVHSRERRRRI
jgi:site-specific recombinase XerD